MASRSETASSAKKLGKIMPRLRIYLTINYAKKSRTRKQYSLESNAWTLLLEIKISKPAVKAMPDCYNMVLIHGTKVSRFFFFFSATEGTGPGPSFPEPPPQKKPDGTEPNDDRAPSCYFLLYSVLLCFVLFCSVPWSRDNSSMLSHPFRDAGSPLRYFFGIFFFMY